MANQATWAALRTKGDKTKAEVWYYCLKEARLVIPTQREIAKALGLNLSHVNGIIGCFKDEGRVMPLTHGHIILLSEEP